MVLGDRAIGVAFGAGRVAALRSDPKLTEMFSGATTLSRDC
jgi:hypothetical protein